MIRKCIRRKRAKAKYNTGRIVVNSWKSAHSGHQSDISTKNTSADAYKSTPILISVSLALITQIDNLQQKEWIPYIGETFNGRGNAVRYPARYSFRTAIFNSGIVKITETEVSIRYKDYADDGKTKVLTAEGTKFIDLFLRHILPARFNRMRFAGYLSNCKKLKILS